MKTKPIKLTPYQSYTIWVESGAHDAGIHEWKDLTYGYGGTREERKERLGYKRMVRIANLLEYNKPIPCSLIPRLIEELSYLIHWEDQELSDPKYKRQFTSMKLVMKNLRKHYIKQTKCKPKVKLFK